MPKARITKIQLERGFLQIETLAREIWTEHYTPIIGSSQVEYMLNKFQSVATMQKQVSEGYEYYGIHEANELIGYFSFLPEANSLFLSKIYVLAEKRGKGVGSMAMKFIESEAEKRGLPSLRLTVNKYNPSIAIYLKMGFENVGPVVFDIGGGYIMDDYEMQKEL